RICFEVELKNDNTQIELILYKGRILVTEFDQYSVTTRFSLINLYAPNVEEGRRRFFDKLKPFCVYNSISVGDFNVWRTRLDAPSRSSFKRDELRERLKDLLMNQEMMDAWRDLNLLKRRQTVMGT
uniref:Endonuclease/exonuclease/phosphatase domain-containing protein n=1 Tax=Poecilia mexicana TaxID=48701 RepID=A0A3B3X5Y0_9TELE